MVHDLLVIVPCGQKKVWEKHPEAGPTMAKDVYAGSPFIVNRKFADAFGKPWVILSAKYGFIDPQFMMPGPYNVTFKRKSTDPISVTKLRDQVRQQGLDRFSNVIGLGGKEYRQVIE
jgi:hypothetical protein